MFFCYIQKTYIICRVYFNNAVEESKHLYKSLTQLFSTFPVECYSAQSAAAAAGVVEGSVLAQGLLQNIVERGFLCISTLHPRFTSRESNQKLFSVAGQLGHEAHF